MSQFVDLSEQQAFEITEGVVGRPLFGEATMLNVVELEPGAEVALHSHPHEQLGLVLEGELIFTVSGEDRHLYAGHAFQLPGGVEHSVRAGEAGCRVLDVFTPVRDDYRERAASSARAKS